MLLQLGGSIVAILVLAGIAWALGLGGGGIADEADACRLADEALGGFAPAAALVAEGSAAALVRGHDGRIAALKVHGSNVACREVTPPVAVLAGPNGSIRVATGDRWFGAVRLAGVTEADVRRLESPLTPM